MKTREIVNSLRRYNEWRRGADIEHPDPKKLGLLIDLAAKRLNDLEVALDRSTAYLDDFNNDSKNLTVKNQLEQNYKLLK